MEERRRFTLSAFFLCFIVWCFCFSSSEAEVYICFQAATVAGAGVRIMYLSQSGKCRFLYNDEEIPSISMDYMSEVHGDREAAMVSLVEFEEQYHHLSMRLLLCQMSAPSGILALVPSTDGTRGGCQLSGFVSLFDVPVVGAQDVSSVRTRIFPNPSHSSFCISNVERSGKIWGQQMTKCEHNPGIHHVLFVAAFPQKSFTIVECTGKYAVCGGACHPCNAMYHVESAGSVPKGGRSICIDPADLAVTNPRAGPCDRTMLEVHVLDKTVGPMYLNGVTPVSLCKSEDSKMLGVHYNAGFDGSSLLTHPCPQNELVYLGLREGTKEPVHDNLDPDLPYFALSTYVDVKTSTKQYVGPPAGPNAFTGYKLVTTATFRSTPMKDKPWRDTPVALYAAEEGGFGLIAAYDGEAKPFGYVPTFMCRLAMWLVNLLSLGDGAFRDKCHSLKRVRNFYSGTTETDSLICSYACLGDPLILMGSRSCEDKHPEISGCDLLSEIPSARA